MVKKYGAALLLVLCLLMMSGCSINVEETMEKAQDLMYDDDYAGAAELYKKVLDQEPENEYALECLYHARVYADFTDADAWVDFLTLMAEKNYRYEALDAISAAEGKLPQDEEVQSLLSRFRPPTPWFFYKNEDWRPPSSEIHDGDTFDTALETAFFIQYGMDYTAGPWVTQICYSINGEERTVDFNDSRDDSIFSVNPSIFLTKPGNYTVEMRAYAEREQLWSGSRTVEFSIPEDCVGKVALSVPGGSYETLGGVQLSTEHEGSTIYYTTDGTDPVAWGENGETTIQGTPYSGMISLDPGTTTVSARCVNEGGIVGELASATYEVKSSHPYVAQVFNLMGTDGRFIYLGTNHGLIRTNYDGSDETTIFTGRINDIVVLQNGKVVFNATPKVEFNQQNPYYVYYYENGKIDRSNGRTGGVSLRGVGNRLYLGDTMLQGDGEEPLNDAQLAAKIVSDKYNISNPGTDDIVVSDPDGSNQRTVVYGKELGVGVVQAHALMGDKLVYSTYYHKSYKGKYYDSDPPIYHFYVMDLTTGESSPRPELDAIFNEQAKKNTDSYNVGGFTSDAVYYWKRAYIDKQEDIEWVRVPFEW